MRTASRPIISQLLDEAVDKRFTGGVLGVRAQPEWTGPAEFDHQGQHVRVVACPSPLAVREALLDRAPDRWLVLLTDADEQQLGLGITAHLIGGRLRSPDSWAAVRDAFGAQRLDHKLVTHPAGRDLADGLLAAAPHHHWPPARSGLLTAGHAIGAVAETHLRLAATATPPDLGAVLRWSATAAADTRVADLRALAGDALWGATVDWIAERAGGCGPALHALLQAGRIGDAVAWGLIARCVLTAPAESGPRALFSREVGASLPESTLTGWAAEAENVTSDLISSENPAAGTVLARAETLLDIVDGDPYAAASHLLRRGLTTRLAALGGRLRHATERAAVRADAHGPDQPLVEADELPAIEEALTAVRAHALARHSDESRAQRAEAGVRLIRWLSQPTPTTAGLPAALRRHRDTDSWVDTAVGEAWNGVDDEALARGLRGVLAAVRLRRAAHDQHFGPALATHHGDLPADLVHIEDLLARHVLPVAAARPTLLIVADGMSADAANEIIDDAQRRLDGWLECVPAGQDRRLAAVAALPSLTHISRASLLCGQLTTGEQAAERAGFAALTAHHRLAGRLFHKLSLDTSRPGHALADDVAAAIDDTAGIAVVACVVNTIDDALDRSDPGGVTWTADAVKHLRPLLDRARRAGRAVVLTADHGHVVERREGRLRTAGGRASSNRSRPYDGELDETAEVRVRGPRVLEHGGDAILAVDERLRYGPLKAGYHGGAAPAEVLVPVSLLVCGGDAPPGWQLAPPQTPPWWRAPIVNAAPPAATGARPGKAKPTPVPHDEGLFTLPMPGAEPTGADLTAAVLASAAYREQRSRAVRVPLTDEHIRTLLAALLAAPAHRLDPQAAATALGIPMQLLGGALPQAQRLLNIEQYPVLRRDPDGDTVVLDVDLLTEQFGLTR